MKTHKYYGVNSEMTSNYLDIRIMNSMLILQRKGNSYKVLFRLVEFILQTWLFDNKRTFT